MVAHSVYYSHGDDAMFGEKFKRRARLEGIAEFILTGSELLSNTIKKDSLEEQYSRLHKVYIKSLKNMKNRILAESWDDLNDQQANVKFGDIIFPVFDAGSDINDLYFRAGLLAGFSIAPQPGGFKETK